MVQDKKKVGLYREESIERYTDNMSWTTNCP